MSEQLRDNLDMALAVAEWIEAQRGPEGYGGPVAHWWRDNLVDCRPGHDWRYEGILAGYLDLHRATGDQTWLERCRAAADDLVRSQSEDGSFSQSRFELNPGTGGTPHEAAAATGLLRLAADLRESDARAAGAYVDAARRCLIGRHVAQLWDDADRVFTDGPAGTFVPNKACTVAEALMLLAAATADDEPIERYVRPTLEAVLRLQVRRPGDRLDGAIAQNSFGGRMVQKFFPYYVARCVPALLAMYHRTGEARWADAALAAGRFLERCQEVDGGFPQVLYGNGAVNRFPRWVAATGDILRATDALGSLGLRPMAATRAWLTEGLLPTGSVMTAQGFAAQGTQRTRPGDPPELRDLLPVTGWMDKALRYFAGRAVEEGPAPSVRTPRSLEWKADCTFGGRRAVLRLSPQRIELIHRRRCVYRWVKGTRWAEIAEPWMAVR